MANFKRHRAQAPYHSDGESESFEEEDDEDGMLSNSHLSRNAKAARAAKGRRDKEAVVLAELASLLPFPQSTIRKLDKGAILRLTISYLRMKQYTQKDGEGLLNELIHQNGYGCNNNNINSNIDLDEGSLMLEALNGFLIFIDKKGSVRYVSPHVYKHLGVKQEQMLGSWIMPFLHMEDVPELTRQMMAKPPPVNKTLALPPSAGWSLDSEDTDDLSPEQVVESRLFYLRMKCHVTRKKNRQSGFLLIQWSGHIKVVPSVEKPGKYNLLGMIAICRPMQSSPIMDIRLDGNMFTSRHALDMRFTFCDPSILNLVGYEPNELIGKTAYEFHNPVDASKIQSCHQNLIVKGTSISKYYRFLSKRGDWIWMQTRATIIYNTANSPQYVVCMNYVIGEEEGRRFHLVEQEEKRQTSDCNVPAVNIYTVSSSPQSEPSPRSEGYVSAEDDPRAMRTTPNSPACRSLNSDSQPQTPTSSLDSADQDFEDDGINLCDLTQMPLTQIQDLDKLLSDLSDMNDPIQDGNGLPLWSNDMSSFTDRKYEEQMDVDKPPVVYAPPRENGLNCSSSQLVTRPLLGSLLTAKTVECEGQRMVQATGRLHSGGTTTVPNNMSMGPGTSAVAVHILPSQEYLGINNQGFYNRLAETIGDNMASMGMAGIDLVDSSMMQPTAVNTTLYREVPQQLSPSSYTSSLSPPLSATSTGSMSPQQLSPKMPTSTPIIIKSPHSFVPTTTYAPSNQMSVVKLDQVNLDHNYPSRQLPQSPPARAKGGMPSRGRAAAATAKPSVALEQILLSSVPMDPNKGSDHILAPEQDLRQLRLNGDNSNKSCLERLLDGSMKTTDVNALEQSHINHRRLSSQSPQQSVAEPEPEPPLVIDPLDSILPTTDIDNFWPPGSTDPETLFLKAELEDLIEAESKHDAAWYKQFCGDLGHS